MIIMNYLAIVNINLNHYVWMNNFIKRNFIIWNINGNLIINHLGKHHMMKYVSILVKKLDYIFIIPAISQNN